MEQRLPLNQGILGQTQTTSTTIPVREEIPFIENVVQQPIIQQREIITEVPIVQQQRVIEKQDIIENQPVKVGETQTIRVTTTTVPTPLSVLQGTFDPMHLQQGSLMQTGISTTGEMLREDLQLRDQRKDEFIGEHREMKPPEDQFLGTQQLPLGGSQLPLGQSLPLGQQQMGSQIPLQQPLAGSTVAGEYFVTKEPSLLQPAQTFTQQPFLGGGIQQPMGQPQLVTETIVHPVYDAHGRMTLPRDIREENLLNHPENAPVVKEGFGTKIKRMLHIGRNKGVVGQPGVVGENYSSPSSSPSPDRYKEKHTIKQGHTLTGKDKYVEKEKIVR